MPLVKDEKMIIMPTFEEQKVKRQDWHGRGLEIDALEILEYMMKSVRSNTPMQIYIDKDNKFVFVLKQDMTEIYHREDFVEDFLKFWIHPSEYAFFETWDDYFLSNDFNRGYLNRTFHNFANAGVKVMNLDKFAKDIY
jgi:hypothetical protein